MSQYMPDDPIAPRSDRMYRFAPDAVRTPLRQIGEAAGAAFQAPVDVLFPGSTAAAEAILEKARGMNAGALFQSPADLVVPGSTAAGRAALEAVRQKARQKVRDVVREEVVPPAAKAGAGGAILAVLGLSAVIGTVYALSKSG